MATVTVQHEGADIEVELPDGYLTPEQVRSQYLLKSVVDDTYVLKAEMDRRFKNWVHKDKAGDDEEIVNAILEKHGKSGKKADFDLEAAKAEWKRAELDPVVENQNRLLDQVRRSALRDAARKAGFDAKYTDGPAPGMPSYFESVFADRLQYDNDLGYMVAVDSAGNRLAATEPTKERPYADAHQLFGDLAGKDEWKEYLAPDPKNNGSGYNGTSTPAKSTKKWDSLSVDEKVKAISEHGSDARHQYSAG